MRVADKQHGGFVYLSAPGGEFSVWMALRFAVFFAGGAELAEGDGEAAGFSEEVAAVAEAVCQLGVAECPCGFDEPPVVGRAAERFDLGGGAEPVRRQAGRVGGVRFRGKSAPRTATENRGCLPEPVKSAYGVPAGSATPPLDRTRLTMVGRFTDALPSSIMARNDRVSSGTVRAWHGDRGFGVIDSADTPGGCWVHFSDVVTDGLGSLRRGDQVTFTHEAMRQDEFDYRAVRVWPPGVKPGTPQRESLQDGPSAAYQRRLTIRWSNGTVTEGIPNEKREK